MKTIGDNIYNYVVIMGDVMPLYQSGTAKLWKNNILENFSVHREMIGDHWQSLPLSLT